MNILKTVAERGMHFHRRADDFSGDVGVFVFFLVHASPIV